MFHNLLIVCLNFHVLPKIQKADVPGTYCCFYKFFTLCIYMNKHIVPQYVSCHGQFVYGRIWKESISYCIVETRFTVNQHTEAGIGIKIRSIILALKNSVCKTLVNRAETICEVNSIDNELEHLENVLREFIHNAMKRPRRVEQRIGLHRRKWSKSKKDKLKNLQRLNLHRLRTIVWNGAK